LLASQSKATFHLQIEQYLRLLSEQSGGEESRIWDKIPGQCLPCDN